MKNAMMIGLMMSLASPVYSQVQHPYEYETAVVSDPVLVTGKGSVQLRIYLPPGVEGLMMSPHLKGCETFGHPEPVIDEDIVFILRNRHPDNYHVTVVIGDRQEGRSQYFCPRLPYVPWGTLIPHEH